MTQFRLARDDARDLVFNGNLAAAVKTSHDHHQGKRWYELALYQTPGGKFICERVGRTLRRGERDRHGAAFADDADEVFAYFGGGDLAKALYEKAGLDFSQAFE